MTTELACNAAHNRSYARDDRDVSAGQLLPAVPPRSPLDEIRAHVDAIREHAAAAVVLVAPALDVCCRTEQLALGHLLEAMRKAVSVPAISRHNAIEGRLSGGALADFVTHLRLTDQL